MRQEPPHRGGVEQRRTPAHGPRQTDHLGSAVERESDRRGAGGPGEPAAGQAKALGDLTRLTIAMALRADSICSSTRPFACSKLSTTWCVTSSAAPFTVSLAFRALRPGGRLALSNYCAGTAGAPHYPVAWAMTADTSFLATSEEMRADLIAAGFEIADFRDTTEAIREAQRRNLARLEQGERPRVAADIILGERAREMQINSLRNAEEGRIRPVEALVRKPG